MIRTKRGNIAAKRRYKFLKMAKGYVGAHSRLSTLATEQVIQSLNYAYTSRRLKKRVLRTLWIIRINGASRLRNVAYSKFMGLLRKSNIFLNRKALSFLAFNQLSTFNSLYRIIFFLTNNNVSYINKLN